MTAPSAPITRKQFAEQLLEHLRTSFLPRLAAGDRELLGWFQERGCEVAHTGSHVSVTLELAHLFNALSSYAQAAGIDTPPNPDWTKQFQEFCKRFMSPWPDADFNAVGLEIRLVRRGNSFARTQIQIRPTQPVAT